MSKGHFQGLGAHRVMLTDAVRMDAFRRAIAAVVRPGDVVVDVGTGTGILAHFAVRAGAAEVHAIDPAPIVRVAERCASDNPGGERIHFYEADAREVWLPRLADVVLSECIGHFFVADDMAPVIRDARRFLRAGGVTVPAHVTLHVAPTCYPSLDDVQRWQSPFDGVDFSAAYRHALQSPYVRHVDPRWLLAPPATLASFDLLDAPDEVSGELEFVVDKAMRLHGFVGWFDAVLAPGVRLDTAPGRDTHWAQVVFPVSQRTVLAGDRIELTLRLTMDSACRHRWRWSGRIVRGTSVDRFAHDTADRFPPSC